MRDYLIFGNVDSREYGIEVFFNDVDYTPKRVYERVEVPGRNGAVLLDEGRYEDVPVAYDCIALDDEDRRLFLNALACQTGYQRMEDSFNLDEFYSAVFEGDVAPNIPKERDLSTFQILFTRKPQRWLKSGEEKVLVDDSIQNPTSFDSSPLIEVEGYGTLNVGDYEIELEDAVLGDVDVTGRATNAFAYLNTDLFNAGDTLTANVTFGYQMVQNGVYADSFTLVSGNASIKRQGNVLYVTVTAPFTAGTSSSGTQTVVVRASIKGTSITDTVTINATIGYHASTADIYASATATSSTFTAARVPKTEFEIIADSTIPILGHPTYIDCDIGQAYRIVDGEMYSLDAYIDLGSDLPVLKGDAISEVTYDNTITSVEITPRWWRI